jgi:hypothetical protein
VNINAWINYIVQFLFELVATLRNGNQLEFCAKILKVRTYSLLLFSKITPPAKKRLMSRVWWCSYHLTVKSCWVIVYSTLLYNCWCRCCLAWWDSTWLGAGMGGWRRVMASRTTSCDVYCCTSLLYSAVFKLWTFISCHQLWFVMIKPLWVIWI